MTIALLRRLLIVVLLAQSSLSLAAVNPITVTFNGGTTNFSTATTGSANYIVALSSCVKPSNVALTFSLTSSGSSAGLTATQQTSGASPCAGVSTLCQSPFSLKAGESCCLAFSLASSSAGSYTLQPSISTTPAAYSAKAASVQNITVSSVIPLTTLSVPATGVISVINSPPSDVVVTNTGADIAYNVQATLPPAWLPAVTQDSSDCATISPGGTCTLHFSSTTPYLAQGNIQVTGTNISSPPSMALAFTVNGYLVWSVSGSVAQVIAASDASAGLIWSPSDINIPGITDTSISPPAVCNGATDGQCNTGVIVGVHGTPYANYAAGICYKIISDNSGVVPLGTWYLPAVCQLSGAGSSANCASGLDNIDTNLFQLDFGGLVAMSNYWSSTESSSSPLIRAWFAVFQSGNMTFQGTTFKGQQLLVRCARSLTF